jgi:hypothetical protein
MPTLLGQNNRLYFDLEFDFRHLRTNQRLQDLCDWANRGTAQGQEQFMSDGKNHYDIANLVKLNMWAADIRRQGIVKPWLILHWADGDREAGTGDSRLRLCEIMPEIRTVRAFISTNMHHADQYCDLESVQSLDRFAELCQADPNQMFLFRPTTPDAPFGIYWYEYDSRRTRAVTPHQDWCVQAFGRYLDQNPGEIDTEWFLAPVNWHVYAGTVQ